MRRFVAMLLGLLLCLPASAADFVVEAVVSVYSGAEADVVLPNAVNGLPVARLGERLFRGNDTVQTVTLPAGLREIADGAFAFCGRLQNVFIDGTNAFFSSRDGVLYDVDGERLIVYPAGRTQTAYVCAPGVLSIANRAFQGNRYLRSISLGGELTRIGNYAFADCEALNEAALPEGLLRIGTSAYANCGNLAAALLPETLVEIGEAAFYNCASLTGLDLPAGLLRIGKNAFANCDALRQVAIPEDVYEIGGGAFSPCRMLEAITVAEDNRMFASVDGALYTDDYARLIAYPAAKNAEKYDAPAGLSRVDRSAFQGNPYLEEIVLPAGVTKIESWAFAFCDALTTLRIPEGVRAIPSYACFACEGLEALYLPASVRKIGYEAFNGCDSLTIYAPAGSYALRYAEGRGIPCQAV